MIRVFSSTFAIITVCACAPQGASENSHPDTFMANLSAHCGKAYAGQMVSTDAVDQDFGSQKMVMHVRNCDAGEIRVPFHVGEDHSRTWVITRTEAGLRLKHDHRHEDGEEDKVTQYGGDSSAITSAERIEFPVDEYSIEMFKKEGLTASVTNVWALELDGEKFAYELRRENRFFRVEFDVTTPVETPPAPWGAE